MIEAGRLIAGLVHYAAADPEEEAALLRILRFLAQSSDPFGRANPEGHITGSAVIGRPGGAAFLLVRHRKLGRWLQPGGHTDAADADVLSTALREAREETGLSTLTVLQGGRPFDVDVHLIPERPGDPAHHHFDLRYLVVTSEAALTAQADEVAGARWFTLDEALAAGVDGSLARALRKAQGLLQIQNPKSKI
ncbi:MAG: NUDIX hydrolase [Thermoanaerobaculia bacterium]